MAPLLVPRPLRRLVALELLFGRRAISLSGHSFRLLADLLAWLYKPVHARLHILPFGRPVRVYHGLVVLCLSGLAARRLTNWAKQPRAKMKSLRKAMEAARSYEEWHQAAEALERLDESRKRMKETFNDMYDADLIRGRVEYLRKIKARGDPYELMFVLRSDLIRNAGNIADATTSIQPPATLPGPIRQYIKLTKECLQDISNSPLVPHAERLAFLRETRHAFGRTALVLSGGGSFGAFHLGVVKALLDAKLLPRVLSGSSAGAIVVALVGTRTREELTDLFSELDTTLSHMDFYSHNTPLQLTRHLLTKGTLQDYRVLQDRLRHLLGEQTFEEAYARSGLALNVAVSAADTTEPVRLLNYLTAPNVLIWSAVACSSAFPFLFAPQTLLARDSRGHIAPFANKAAGESQRRWRDGSLESDLPMRGLSEMFNVNYFLVSQCNPYLLPVIAAKEALPRPIGSLLEMEFKHRCQQLMEIMPKRTLRLLKLLSQPWSGDTTVFLPVTTLSALKSIVNMSKEDILRAKSAGQKATWAKLMTITTNCDIETCMDECLRQVSLKSRQFEMSELGKRVRSKSHAQMRSNPSWLRLSSLTNLSGLTNASNPPSANNDNNDNNDDNDDNNDNSHNGSSSAIRHADSFEGPGVDVSASLKGLNRLKSLNSLKSMSHMDACVDADVVEAAGGRGEDASEQSLPLDVNKGTTWNNLFNLAGNKDVSGAGGGFWYAP